MPALLITKLPRGIKKMPHRAAQQPCSRGQAPPYGATQKVPRNNATQKTLPGRLAPSEQQRMSLSLARPSSRLLLARPFSRLNASSLPRARPRPAQYRAGPGQPASHPSPPTWPPIPARCAVPPSPAQQPRRLEARNRRDPAVLLHQRFLCGKVRSRLEQQQPAAKGGER